jgi:hypothetical protein
VSTCPKCAVALAEAEALRAELATVKAHLAAAKSREGFVILSARMGAPPVSMLAYNDIVESDED